MPPEIPPTTEALPTKVVVPVPLIEPIEALLERKFVYAVPLTIRLPLLLSEPFSAIVSEPPLTVVSPV